MLLLIDHLALRARNYEYLIRLFQEWEVRVSRTRALKWQLWLLYLSGPRSVCLGNSLRTRCREPESAQVDQPPAFLAPLLLLLKIQSS